MKFIAGVQYSIEAEDAATALSTLQSIVSDVKYLSTKPTVKGVQLNEEYDSLVGEAIAQVPQRPAPEPVSDPDDCERDELDDIPL